jgi:hypothetical protein
MSDRPVNKSALLASCIVLELTLGVQPLNAQLPLPKKRIGVAHVSGSEVYTCFQHEGGFAFTYWRRRG